MVRFVIIFTKYEWESKRNKIKNSKQIIFIPMDQNHSNVYMEFCERFKFLIKLNSFVSLFCRILLRNLDNKWNIFHSRVAARLMARKWDLNQNRPSFFSIAAGSGSSEFFSFQDFSYFLFLNAFTPPSSSFYDVQLKECQQKGTRNFGVNFFLNCLVNDKVIPWTLHRRAGLASHGPGRLFVTQVFKAHDRLPCLIE